MSENKTRETDADVAAFIERIGDAERRADAEALVAIMERATGEKARMWGTSIIGFGHYRYRYESGREGEGAPVGFSPRAKELVLYPAVHSERTPALLARLGKHKEGKACIYVKSLADVDEAVLEALIADAYKATYERYPKD